MVYTKNLYLRPAPFRSATQPPPPCQRASLSLTNKLRGNHQINRPQMKTAQHFLNFIKPWATTRMSCVDCSLISQYIPTLSIMQNTLNQCYFNVWPWSLTLGQQLSRNVSMPLVFWVVVAFITLGHSPGDSVICGVMF